MLNTVKKDIRTFWHNGTRWLLVAFLAFIASILFFFAVTILSLVLFHQREFSPLRSVSPQRVLSPAAFPGGVVEVEATKCNDGDESLSVTGEANLRNVTTGRLYHLREGTGVIEPGCVTRTFRNDIPEDVPQGMYRIEGFDLAVSDTGQPQREPFFSEPFRVMGGVP